MAAATPRLRIARADDAEAVAAIYAPIVADTVISFEEIPPDADEMRRRIESTLATHAWLVAEKGADVVGYAYASPHRGRAAYRWSMDVSVYLAERARRRGIGSALYTALLGIGRAQGFHRAYGGVTLPNAASEALHERHGFGFVGRYGEVGFKRGAWHDVGWWELALAQPSGAPGEPRPFPTWRASAEGRRALAALGIDG